MFSLSLYRHALRPYPASHRERFGEEMVAAFPELQNEAASKRMIAGGDVCVREARGVIAGPCANIGEFGAANTSGYCFPIGGLRCAEFRFPKATAVLMTIILAGVILAIERGEAIHTSLP
jgi:hypothetical protein